MLWIMCATCWGQAPELAVEYGPGTVPLDQYFTISLKKTGARPEKVEGFPEIEGLQKSTQRRSAATYRTGNKTTVVHTLTQQYAPLREGDFSIKPFTLQVDGKPVTAPAFKGKVEPMALVPGKSPSDTVPAAGPMAAPEFADVKDNAFLTLHLPKQRVFVGESVPVSLWFYVADTDLGLLDFYQFEPQLLAAIQLLKQRSALEQTVAQQEITPEKTQIGGKAFTRYKLYEAVLFPITAQALRFPVVQLQMIKYKIAKTPSLLNQNRLPDYKTYTTSAQRVEVRALPPHPLRDQVAVGVFRLREQLSRNTISLNQNLVYQMQIEGEGNIKALPLPQNVGVSSEVEVYTPEIRQQDRVAGGQVVGSKTFRYFIVGRQAGQYALRDLFQWVYFNPSTARYDTLRPSVVVRVRGQEDQNSFIRAQPLGDFYNIIETEKNQPIPLDYFKGVRQYTNIALAVMGLASLFVFFIRRK